MDNRWLGGPAKPNRISTLVEHLCYRAQHQPEQLAVAFLPDGGTECVEQLSYGEMDRRARRVAVQLQALGLAEQRALLLYPPGLDFLIAFLGCLYSRVIAVPLALPLRRMERLQPLAADARAKVALTTARMLKAVAAREDGTLPLAPLPWLATDAPADGEERHWQPPPTASESLAYLQYTSGSTAAPRGVMITHANLLQNMAATVELYRAGEQDVALSWLPHFHDMGLVGGLLEPLYAGVPCYWMPPPAFIQQPLRWLEAIDRYRVTHSGGPNFAYELCARKSAERQPLELDLSCWAVAYCGAEPVRAEVLTQFAETFGCYGFRAQAFCPTYGLAEATLQVTSVPRTEAPRVYAAQPQQLEQGLAVQAPDSATGGRLLVSCGRPTAGTQVLIVHPQRCTRCARGEIGEIWIAGPAVAGGYWQQPEATQRTFGAYLADTGEGPFLRTGDLGFEHGGELFVCGRCKDLIILYGRNLYPQDIEWTVQQSHPALRTDAGAAFAVDMAGQERLVVAQELDFRQVVDIEAVAAAIRQAVYAEHEVQVYTVVLLQAGSIPRTSSGKIRRQACSNDFRTGKLAAVGSSTLEPADEATDSPALTRTALLAAAAPERPALLAAYVQQQLAQRLRTDPSRLDPDTPLGALGLDSLTSIELKARIEADLGVTVLLEDFLGVDGVQGLTRRWLDQLEQPEAVAREPLQPMARPARLPLSFAQERLWFLEQLEPGNPFYHIALSCRLEGALDVSALERSFNAVLERHEVLRTTFSVAAGRPIQRIAPFASFQLPVLALQHLEAAERTAEAARLTGELAVRPFALAVELPMRLQLLRLGEQDHQLLLVFHHIAFDEWSARLLVHELSHLYRTFHHDQSPQLPPPELQYADFALQQRHTLQGDTLHSLLDFWQQLLPKPLPVLQLPTDHPRPPVQTFGGRRYTLTLDPALSEHLSALARRHQATLFMTLLAAFAVLLGRYSAQPTVLIGTPAANRERQEMQQMMGLLTNTLVLPIDLSGDPDFATLLARVRQMALQAYEHQQLPFEKLVEHLQPQRELGQNPLFQVLFSLQNAPLQPWQWPDALRVVPETIDTATAKFDVSLAVVQTEQGLLRATFEYNCALFEAATIERWAGHYQNLLAAVVADPKLPVSQLPILGASERRQLQQWGRGADRALLATSVVELLTAQLKRTPQAIAVVDGQEQLSYEQLDERAGRLAGYLRGLGVGVGVRVGVLVERSVAMVVAVVAVLKAGGAYVPLEASLPVERLRWLVSDAGVRWVLSDESTAGLAQSLPVKQVGVEEALGEGKAGEAVEFGGQEEAYVIYTSGSTGKPKGVMMTHAPLVNLLSWQAEQLPGAARTLQFASLGFDVSFQEIFSTWCTGGTLVLIEEATRTDPISLWNVIVESAIERLFLPYVALQQLAEVAGCHPHLPVPLQEVIVAGEQLRITPQIANFFGRLPGCTLHNHYGPTESHVVTACTLSGPPQNWSVLPPIGRPIANVRIVVLDGYLQPVPIGIPGELYIGGAGLARGYLNQPELTAERFIAPSAELEAGSRLYRTGDRARWRPDGQLEFLGRLDGQIKLRGFRIEPGEIEAVLAQHPAVRQAVVMVREEVPGPRRLVAYIVSTPEARQQEESLRQYLRERLPQYMVPSAFVHLAALPLTPNGKVDRTALPPPAGRRQSDPDVVPCTPLEKQIATIWAQVLGMEDVGRHDNFFDLGGHSLLATQVRSRLREELQVELPLRPLFETPTVSGLARVIAGLQGQRSDAECRPIPKASRGTSAEQLLAALPQLTDRQVEVLLDTLLSEREVTQ